MECCIVLPKRIQVTMSKCHAHGIEFVLQSTRVALQHWSRSSSGDLFQCGSYLVSFLRLFRFWRLNDCRGFSQKSNHAECLEFGKSSQHQVFVEIILRCDFGNLQRLARTIATTKYLSGQPNSRQFATLLTAARPCLHCISTMILWSFSLALGTNAPRLNYLSFEDKTGIHRIYRACISVCGLSHQR